MVDQSLQGAHSNLEPTGQGQQQAAGLKLFVMGFNDTERKLLQGVVFLSKRRAPRIDLVGEQDIAQADVVMIDTHNYEAMLWAHAHPLLHDKPVIWVDGSKEHPGHLLVRRPIQWPMLPVLLYQALDHAKKPAAVPAASQNNRNILIIEDSLPARTHLKSLLQARGYGVAEASDAQAGLQADAQTSYACVLMDVMMPGMDGYEACRRIKSAHAGGKAPAVVMLTSKSSPFDRIRGKMAGCDDYLTKPVEPERLYEVLSHFVLSSDAGRPMHALRPEAHFAHS